MSKKIPIAEYLSNELNKQDKNLEELAGELKITRQNLYLVRTGRTRISRKLANKLSEVLGNTSDFWLRSEVLVNDEYTSDETCSKENVHFEDENKPATLLVDSQIKNAVDNGQIKLSGFNIKNLSSASYDFTVGDKINVFEPAENDVKSVDISEEDYTLKCGEIIQISTAEEVTFPVNYLGRVGAVSEHAKKGLFISHGLQIDPGYHGHLTFTARYDGVSRFSIFKGMRILSIEIMKLYLTPEKSYQDYWGDPRQAIRELFNTLLKKAIKYESFSELAKALKASDETEPDNIEFSSYDKFMAFLREDPSFEVVNELNSISNSIDLSSVQIDRLLTLMKVEEVTKGNTTYTNGPSGEDVTKSLSLFLEDSNLFSFAQKINRPLIEVINCIGSDLS